MKARPARDAHILEALRSGASLRAVAARVGLSPQRVSQIARRGGLRPQRRGRQHGVSGYAGGCRCATCREANRQRGQAYRGTRRPPPSHGLSGYMNHLCRCEVCRAAKADQNRRQRERRQALLAAAVDS